MAVVLTNETFSYLETLASNGMVLVDSGGKGDFAPSVKNLVTALHEVLAGGEVQISIKSGGDEGRKAVLDLSLRKALDSVNAAISESVGYSP